MNVHLSPEAEAVVRAQVESGRFATADEAIEAAVRLLDDRDEPAERLRSRLHVGLDEWERGETVPLTPALFDAIEGSIEARFRRGEQPDPDVCP